jgi:hypothetical protein
MLFGIDLTQTFTFPFKGDGAWKHFLIGCLVSLAAFIIPVIPFLVLYGYAVRIVKQIINAEPPHMVEWDDWGGMIKDGAKLFGIRIIYAIPVLILAAPLFISAIVMPFIIGDGNNSHFNVIFPILMVVMFGSICILIPVSFVLAFITPAAEMYMVEKGEFSAGFRIREWWTILRANIGGFVAAVVIFYIATMVMSFAIQIIGATLIFACLLPFLFPAITMYSTLIMYTTIAQAYKASKEKLAPMPTP